MGRRSTIALLAGTFAAGCAGSAFAELTYSVEAGVGRSDNIARTPDDEISETLATVGATLEWHEQRPRLYADVSADADYVEYLDDTYDGEVVGGLDGLLDFTIVQDRLRWMVQDSFGQESTDPFSPVTPETRENVNYFTTGPSFEFPVGSKAVRIFGTYSMTDYETNPFDNDRVVGGLSFGPAGINGRGFGVNAVTERVRFDEEANVDFDRDSLFVSYSIQGARTEISAEAGYTWLELEGGEKNGDPRLQIEMERELSSASTLTVRAGTQLTDSSNVLRSSLFSGAPPGMGGGTVTSSSDPYRNRYGALYWNFTKNRTTLALGIDWSDDTYETQPQFDRDRMQYSASVGRQVTSRLRIGINGTFADEEFDLSGLASQTLELGASAEWQIGQTLALQFTLLHSDRDSDSGAGEYTENRALLNLVFRPGTRRTGTGTGTRAR